MLLTIDIGNTNTLFALADVEEERIIKSWRCVTHSSRTADEYCSFLIPLFQADKFNMKDIESVIVSSVVPDANMHIQRFCEIVLELHAIFVTKDNAKVDIQIERPEDLGADRIVNTAACLHEYKSACIILDFGTATTFDVIDQKGAYIGGIISPGINLSRDALNMAAAKLPKVSVKKPPAVIGQNTTHAIQSGLFWGYASLIEGLVAKIKKEQSDNFKVIATGGLAVLFAEHLSVIDVVDQDLTLKGLIYIFKNQKEQS